MSFSAGFANYTPLITTIQSELQTIQSLIDPSGIDLSGVYARQDLGNSILADISNDLSSYFSQTDAILVDISNGIGAIDTTALVDICAGQDIVISEIQSGNATLGSIDGFALKIDDYLQPKAFSIFGTSSAPSLPFAGNFVSVPCVWKKVVCDTAVSNPTGIGWIITTFYDTSGTPTGSEPVLLRMLHPSLSQSNGITGAWGTPQHDIEFPDGGLICNDGIGVICQAFNSSFFSAVSITGYYTT